MFVISSTIIAVICNLIVTNIIASAYYHLTQRSIRKAVHEIRNDMQREAGQLAMQAFRINQKKESPNDG